MKCFKSIFHFRLHIKPLSLARTFFSWENRLTFQFSQESLPFNLFFTFKLGFISVEILSENGNCFVNGHTHSTYGGENAIK